jgi:HAD superfamily hydrolase (TIGR01456 family)
MLSSTFYKASRIVKSTFTRHATRNFSTKGMAIAMDIDGVLLRGGKAIPGAVSVIQDLDRLKIPYVFLTNGSGTTEEKKAESLGNILGIKVAAENMLVASSPMQELVNDYRNKPVLFVGKDSSKEVAGEYGFEKVITAEELHRQIPSLYPDIPVTQEPRINERFEAIFVIADPIPWGRDLQICIDLLRSNGKITEQIPDTSQQEVPIYFSTADFQYSGEFPLPRFGSGSFLFAMKALFQEVTGKDMKYTLFGKPETRTFKYAEKRLADIAVKLGQEPPAHFYMCGDNPLSDIKGANNAGDAWTSVLTCTGMYTGGVDSNDCVHPADVVVKDIREALNEIMKIQVRVARGEII